MAQSNPNLVKEVDKKQNLKAEIINKMSLLPQGATLDEVTDLCCWLLGVVMAGFLGGVGIILTIIIWLLFH